MTNKEVAKFHGLSLGGFKHWTPEQRRRARIEAEIGAEPGIAGLLAELQRLAWVYNCANVRGASQPLSCSVLVPTASSCTVNFYLEHSFTPERHIFINLDAHNAVAQLKNAKSLLEQHIYGAEKNAR